MLQAMRNRVKMIYWIVIITFVGLTFLVWGIGFDRSRRQAESGTVATVNKTDITVAAFQERVRALAEQMQSQRGDNAEPLTDNQMIRAREQAYDDLVMEALIKEQVDKLGLTATDAEVQDILHNSPPAYLLSLFKDDKGNVDYEAYNRELANPSPQWRQAIAYLKDTLPLQKLEQRVTAAAVVGETEIRDAFAEQYVKGGAEYAAKMFNEIPMAQAQPTDDQIKAYYDSHQPDYTQPERATVKLASVKVEPSAEDDAEVKGILLDIRKDIVNHKTTFADAAMTYSEDPSAKDGGDLGFFDRNRMVAPFTEAAFSLPVGEISQPVRTQFGYHLITVTDEKLAPAKKGEKPERSEVRASHILLKVRPSQTTLVSLRERVDAARADASTMGIEEAAKTHGLEMATTPAFQETFNIPGIPNSLGGTRFVFSNPPGTISPVYETEDVDYFFQIDQRLPAGVRPLDDVRAMVVSQLQKDERAEKAAQALDPAWAKVQAGETLEKAAKETGLTYGTADSFSFRENIKGIGFATAFARAALSLEPGQMLKDVRTPTGTYIVKLLWKSPFDEDLFKKKRNEIAQSLLFNRRRQIMDEWTKSLKAHAKIVDRRTPDML